MQLRCAMMVRREVRCSACDGLPDRPLVQAMSRFVNHAQLLLYHTSITGHITACGDWIRSGGKAPGWARQRLGTDWADGAGASGDDYLLLEPWASVIRQSPH